MANVLFKKGLQAKLPATRDAGTFYVTTDTHRLYLGQDLLSQAVETVDAIANLPSGADARRIKGQIYYCVAENILCTYDPTANNNAGDWKQINPDTDTKYAVSSAANSTAVTLTASGSASAGPAGSVTLEAGDSSLVVDGTDAGKIKFKHGAVTTTDNASAKSAVAPVNGGSFDAIKGVTIDNGHVTAIDYETVTLPTYTAKAVTAADDGKLVFGINGASGDTVTSESILFNKITVDGTEATVYNQKSIGTFYSASKVDELITKAQQDMNAMTYKGVMATAPAATLKPQNGDTYKVTASITIGEQTAKDGDLIIYSGADVTDTVAYDLTKWTVIPAGDDVDTTYTFSVTADHKIKFHNNASNEDVANIEFKAGTALKVESDAGNKTITFSHDVAGANTSVGPAEAQSPASSGTFVVPRITVDAQGHVTAASDITITLPEEKDSKYALSGATVAVADNVVTVTDTLTASGSDSGTTTSAFKIASTSLVNTIDATNKTVSIDLVWGDFGTAES